MLLGNFLELLSFQEASRHTKRTEGRAEQRYCGASIRNLTTWGEKYPPGKAMAQGAKLWNRDCPSEITDVPHQRKIVFAVVFRKEV